MGSAHRAAMGGARAPRRPTRGLRPRPPAPAPAPSPVAKGAAAGVAGGLGKAACLVHPGLQLLLIAPSYSSKKYVQWRK